MAPQYLVSVIIPCYNVSAYVKKAISSIIEQTYTNLEILVIDDASTDDTLAQIKLIKDERIRIIAYHLNTHKIGAVNEVLKNVKGDFIAFQDADDWSEPTRIQEQVNQFIAEPQLGVCFTNYAIIEKKKYFPPRISLTDEELKDEFLEFMNRTNKNWSPTLCATMMINKAVLNTTVGYHPYFKDKVAEDIHWIYRILKNYSGYTINKPLYNYNIREGAFSQIQVSGTHAKYIYSWQLLAKIIYKDIHENIDILEPSNIVLLKEIELLVCESALQEAIKSKLLLKESYENSTNYKLGKLLLYPAHFVKKFLKQRNNSR
jgi:glycosyltransferase involved in cell wall biosynthesis